MSSLDQRVKTRTGSTVEELAQAVLEDRNIDTTDMEYELAQIAQDIRECYDRNRWADCTAAEQEVNVRDFAWLCYVENERERDAEMAWLASMEEED